MIVNMRRFCVLFTAIAAFGQFAAAQVSLSIPVDPRQPRPEAPPSSGAPRGVGGIYQLDDGEIDNALGGNAGEVCWIHAFSAPLGTQLTSISTAWSEYVVNGQPGRIFVWEDPNDDGDPADAVLLHQQNVTAQSPCPGTPSVCAVVEYTLTQPVSVTGGFFVGAATAMSTVTYPAPIDTNSGAPLGVVWFGAGNPTFNPNSLAAAEDLNAFFGPLGVFLLRARGVVSGITYQGRLVLNGAAVDGPADIEFSLFDAVSGGSQVGATQMLPNVSISEGLFSVELPYSSAEFASGSSRYLNIRVAHPAGGPLATLSPRQPVTYAPRALFAAQTAWSGVQGIPAGFADGTDDGGNALDAADGTPANVVSVDADGKVTITGPTRLPSTGTLLHSATNDTGIPSGDGLRLRLDPAFFGGSAEAFVFEKTDPSTGSPDGGIAFVNTGNDNVVETAMVIRGDGNIGIGLNAPTAKLHIGGVAGTDGLRFPDNSLQTTAFALAGNGVATTAARSDHSHSSLAASDGTPAQALAVDTDGNIGIGTAAPDAALHVATVSDVSLAGGGSMIVGAPTALNIAMDDNEIMARNNGATSRLSLQVDGGQVVVGNGSGIADTAPHRLIAVDTQPGLLSLPLRLDNGSSTTGSSTGIGFRVTGTIQPKGALAYERTTSTFGRGKFHFLQNTVADDSAPSLADSVLTITNGGFVGAGVTDPVARMHVNGDSLWVSGTDSGGLGSTAGAGLRMFNSATESAIFAYDYATSTNRNLALQNSGTGAGGNLGVGRSPAANKLEVEGNASKTTAGSWVANSDRRIKKDIATIAGALDTLDKLRLVSFRYTDEYRADRSSIEDREYVNVIAQEFAEVFPDWVKSSGEKLADGSDILQVDTYPITIYTAAAVQELNQKLRERDARLAERDARIAELEARLERIEKALLSISGSSAAK